MEALRKTTAEMIRILTITGDRSLSWQEQVALVFETNDPLRLDIDMQPPRWPWQRAAAQEATDAACRAALKAVNLRIQAAMLTSEHLIARLQAATGESREQILQDLSISVDATLSKYEEPDQ